MKPHRPCTLFGSRLLFFALAPWLVVCIPLFPYMAYNFGQSTGAVLLAGVLSTACALGLLLAIDRRRFLFLSIGLLLLVPAAYVWYFCATFFGDGMPLAPTRRSDASPFNAVLGFVIWGVPSLFLARRLIGKARRLRAVKAQRRRMRSLAP
jgi:hypothetical protein